MQTCWRLHALHSAVQAGRSVAETEEGGTAWGPGCRAWLPEIISWVVTLSDSRGGTWAESELKGEADIGLLAPLLEP